MIMAEENVDVRTNLQELRRQSLRIAALFVCVIGILWLFLVVNPRVSGLRPPIDAWIGSGALVINGWLGYSLRLRFPRLASAFLIAGTLIGAACARLILPSKLQSPRSRQMVKVIGTEYGLLVASGATSSIVSE